MSNPPTLADFHARGDTTAAIDCQTCHRRLVIATDHMPAHWRFIDIPRNMRLVCSGCGGRNIAIMMDITAHYARGRAMAGRPPEPDPDYVVVRLPLPKGVERA